MNAILVVVAGDGEGCLKVGVIENGLGVEVVVVGVKVDVKIARARVLFVASVNGHWDERRA